MLTRAQQTQEVMAANLASGGTMIAWMSDVSDWLNLLVGLSALVLNGIALIGWLKSRKNNADTH